MNNVSLCGRLTEDGLSSMSANNNKMLKFKMAVEKYSKEDENAYEVFEVVGFRNIAEMELKKGQYVGVTGRLSSSNFDKEGKTYYNASVIANNICILGK